MSWWIDSKKEKPKPGTTFVFVTKEDGAASTCTRDHDGHWHNPPPKEYVWAEAPQGVVPFFMQRVHP